MGPARRWRGDCAHRGCISHWDGRVVPPGDRSAGRLTRSVIPFRASEGWPGPVLTNDARAVRSWCEPLRAHRHSGVRPRRRADIVRSVDASGWIYRAIPRRQLEGLGDDGAAPSTGYFAITEDRNHVANSNRIAFWVESDAEVDRIAEVVHRAGAVDLSGPKSMPYSPGYYAAFFADPSGNRLEVYVRPE